VTFRPWFDNEFNWKEEKREVMLVNNVAGVGTWVYLRAEVAPQS
jgi:hypothetical protein